jgi:hypothetical protein
LTPPDPVKTPITSPPTDASNKLAILSVWAGLFPLVWSVGARAVTIVYPTFWLLDILGLLCFPSILLAISFGHLALSQAHRYPPARAYRELAIAGLAVGYLEAIVVLATLGLPFFHIL